MINKLPNTDSEDPKAFWNTYLIIKLEQYSTLQEMNDRLTVWIKYENSFLPQAVIDKWIPDAQERLSLIWKKRIPHIVVVKMNAFGLGELHYDVLY